MTVVVVQHAVALVHVLNACSCMAWVVVHGLCKNTANLPAGCVISLYDDSVDKGLEVEVGDVAATYHTAA
jgi:hypothetical protein